MPAANGSPMSSTNPSSLLRDQTSGKQTKKSVKRVALTVLLNRSKRPIKIIWSALRCLLLPVHRPQIPSQMLQIVQALNHHNSTFLLQGGTREKRTKILPKRAVPLEPLRRAVKMMWWPRRYRSEQDQRCPIPSQILHMVREQTGSR
jgi:hypothetical protein